MIDEKASPAATLRAMSVMIAKIADQVDLRQVQPIIHSATNETPDGYLFERAIPMLAAVAQNEYQSRKRRSVYLSSAPLSDAAWDMLLDLFVQKAFRRKVSATSAAIAAGAPYATMLRHFELLERAGLIERTKSETDARVTFVSLTKEGFRKVGAYLLERANSMNLSHSGAFRPAIAMEEICPDEPVSAK